MPVIITIKVVPSSGSRSWKIDKSGVLKCFLKSQPEKGKANKELLSFLAESLGVSGSVIELLTGETARIKRVRINLDFSYEAVIKKLGLEPAEKPLKIF